MLRRMLPPRCLSLLLLLPSAHGARLAATANGTLALDGETPFTLRAILYSPTPWGYDEDLHYHNADYTSIFERDLDVIPGGRGPSTKESY